MASMISPRLAMLAVALAFGAALVGQRYWAEPPNPLIGTPEEVRPAEFWATQLPDLQNRAQALKQWQGKVLVVNFWAPWCPPCRKEIPDFIRMQEQLGKQGVQFVGIALDEADKVSVFVDESGINYPILLGNSAAAALSHSAGNRLGGLPYTVLFDRKGNAVATLTGDVTQARLEALLKPLL
jgi:thiol-disulfide isomerase/thioredoxin